MEQGLANISNVDRLKLLRILWEQRAPAIFFAWNARSAPQWNDDEAKNQLYDDIDYLLGRPIKMNFSTDTVDPSLYDRDGPPYFKDALERIKMEQN